MPYLLKAGLAALALCLGVAGVDAQVADEYRDLSRDLVGKGVSALNSGASEDARQLFERALVANPANVAALVGLGRVYEVQDNVPVGLKYYRQALTIEPNNLEALEAQSLAFLKRDLYDEAELNRDRLRRLCRAGCEALTVVETALAEFRVADASTGQETGPGGHGTDRPGDSE